MTLTPEQIEATIAAAAMPERQKKTLRALVAANNPQALFAVRGLHQRISGSQPTPEQIVARYRAANA